MLRRLAAELLPTGVAEAPKRPIQTPQREWLRGPLREWASSHIEHALSRFDGAWFDGHRVREAWQLFLGGEGDNSFFVWQWINTGLMFADQDRRS
jgi:asparagine synthase (glutamine-hydrolysing)